MKILVAGLNHKTAAIEIREKLAFDASQTGTALKQLKQRFSEAEFVLLSTCNRVELYCADNCSGGVEVRDLIKFLSEFHNISRQDFEHFLYVHRDREAVRHLFTVASSLDSMVVGETQIISQVKDSYRLACSAESTSKVLNHLFHRSFATAKEIHTATSISNGRVSVAGVAVDLLKQRFAEPASAKIVVIGAGRMGQLLLQHLIKIGCRDITVVNRCFERGLEISERYGAQVRKWNELTAELAGAEVVIASAAVQDYLFRKGTFEKIMEGRGKQTMLIIDIAVPRNFEPSVGQIDGVCLYSVDELSEVARQNRKAREKDIAQALQIIETGVADFMDWLEAKDIGPLIGRMKEKFEQIVQSKFERSYAETAAKTLPKELVKPAVRRIVNKLAHCIITDVNAVAKQRGAAEAAKVVESIVHNAEELSAQFK